MQVDSAQDWNCLPLKKLAKYLNSFALKQSGNALDSFSVPVYVMLYRRLYRARDRLFLHLVSWSNADTQCETAYKQ